LVWNANKLQRLRSKPLTFGSLRQKIEYRKVGHVTIFRLCIYSTFQFHTIPPRSRYGMLRTFTHILKSAFMMANEPKRVPIPPNGVDYRGKVVLAPMVRSGELPSRLMALKYGADLVWGMAISFMVTLKYLLTKR